MIKKLIALGFKPITFPDVEGNVYQLKVNVHTLLTSKQPIFGHLELEESDIATIDVYPDESFIVSLWDLNVHEGPFDKNAEPGISVLRDIGVI